MKIESMANQIADDSLELKDNQKRVFLYVEDNEMSMWKNYILKKFDNENMSWVLYYSSFEENINELKACLNENEVYEFTSVKPCKRKKKKRHYPVLSVFSNNPHKLYDLLNNWTTEVYTEELICVFNNKDKKYVFTSLLENAYSFENLVKQLLTIENIVIKTIYDASTIHTYDIICNKSFYAEFLRMDCYRIEQIYNKDEK